MKNIVLLLLLFALQQAYGQAGQPDSSFAGKGWTSTSFEKGNLYNENGRQVLPLQDGSSLVVFEVNGYTMLARYVANGSLDTKFAAEGYTGAARLWDAKAALQSNGKIIVAGWKKDATNNAVVLTLLRFNADGSPDKTFNGGGTLSTDFFESDTYTFSLALQGDGKVVLAGTAYNAATYSYEYALARYNPDGSLDKSFDGDGRVTANLGPDARAYTVAVQSDGKIVAGGSVVDFETGESRFALLRFLKNGAVDKSFGVAGRVVMNAGLEVSSLALQGDGKIVVAGHTTSSASGYTSFSLTRINTNGLPDKTFDSDGTVVTSFGADAYTTSIALQPDGKTVVAGYTINAVATNWNIALARYNKDGSLDKAFSSDGKLTTDFFGSDDYGFSVALQRDGKIMLAGDALGSANWDVALVRYNPNGTLDNTFDTDGKLTGYYQAGISGTTAVAAQPDGKIITAGWSTSPGTHYSVFALARYHANGSLDKTFDADGKLTTDFGAAAEGYALAVQRDGKIIVAGTLYNFTTGNHNLALARYNTDGSLDKTFDADGKLIGDFGSQESVSAVALQDDGKIVVAGSANDASGSPKFLVARYQANGSLDKTFDSDGWLLTHFGADAIAASLAVQRDGKIVVAGWSNHTGRQDFALARYTANGALDKTFDSDGKVTTDFGDYDLPAAVAIQANGKIVVSGRTSDPLTGYADFALARYNPNGSLDKTFDADGKLTTDFGGADDLASSILLQEDGKILIAGYTTLPVVYNANFAFACYNANGSLDKTFGSAGKLSVDFGGDDYAAAICLNNKKLYAAGNSLGLIQEGIVAAYLMNCAGQQFFADKDKDGFGNAAQVVMACTAPEGYVANSTDCNDNNAAVHPGAKEICGNKTDDNCDGQIDEGCPGKPFFIIKDVVVQERVGKATVTVRLSRKAAQPVTVRYFTVDGTARSKEKKHRPKDFEARKGVLTFPAGWQTATFSIPVINDGIAEGDEYFEVHLRKPAHATIAAYRAKVTIKDDASPVAPAVYVAPVPVMSLSEAGNVQAKGVPPAAGLAVNVLPNPATAYFTLVLQSNQKSALTIHITDAMGRLVETRAGVGANAVVQLGHNYRPGLYFALIVQERKSVVVKLFKQSD